MTEPQTKATAGADTGPQNMRLFIGGVPHGTTQSELESRFGRYGKVSDVEVVHHANGLEKTFAYITLEQITSSALMKLRATYNNSRWKGSVLRLQKAKPNFQERLALDKAEVSKIIAHMEERAGLRKERKSQTPQYKMNDKNNRTWVPGPRNKPLAMLRIRNPSTHRVKRVKAKDILSRHTDLSGSLGTLKAVPSSQLTWTLESSCSESSDDGFDSDEGSSKAKSLETAKIIASQGDLDDDFFDGGDDLTDNIATLAATNTQRATDGLSSGREPCSDEDDLFADGTIEESVADGTSHFETAGDDAQSVPSEHVPPENAEDAAVNQLDTTPPAGAVAVPDDLFSSDDDTETLVSGNDEVGAGGKAANDDTHTLTPEEQLEAELNSEREKQRHMLEQLLGSSTPALAEGSSGGAVSFDDPVPGQSVKQRKPRQDASKFGGDSSDDEGNFEFPVAGGAVPRRRAQTVTITRARHAAKRRRLQTGNRTENTGIPADVPTMAVRRKRKTPTPTPQKAHDLASRQQSSPGAAVATSTSMGYSDDSSSEEDVPMVLPPRQRISNTTVDHTASSTITQTIASADSENDSDEQVHSSSEDDSDSEESVAEPRENQTTDLETDGARQPPSDQHFTMHGHSDCSNTDDADSSDNDDDDGVSSDVTGKKTHAAQEQSSGVSHEEVAEADSDDSNESDDSSSRIDPPQGSTSIKSAPHRAKTTSSTETTTASSLPHSDSANRYARDTTVLSKKKRMRKESQSAGSKKPVAPPTDVPGPESSEGTANKSVESSSPATSTKRQFFINDSFQQSIKHLNGDIPQIGTVTAFSFFDSLGGDSQGAPSAAEGTEQADTPDNDTADAAAISADGNHTRVAATAPQRSGGFAFFGAADLGTQGSAAPVVPQHAGTAGGSSGAGSQQSISLFSNLFASEKVEGAAHPTVVPTFQRSGDLDDITASWEGNRAELTDDYRKRHKAAKRRQAKFHS
eukprot:m.534979 g.534979  ORF g.534979 m.534979 type:complete len:972 (+) comp22061_c0_seq1:179-3094(+)